MSLIKLHSHQESSVTVVSNYFIDTFMPAANGSYVKVYLYLLRCMSNTDLDISISAIADHLEDSEKDIIRALSYWDKVGIITLEKNPHMEIISISLNDLSNQENTSEETSISQEIQEIQEIQKIQEVPQAIVPNVPKPVYSKAQIDNLTENDEVKWLLKIIEVYLERFLKPADIQLILYLYESIGFSVELIMYLYEYCVSKNKKNPSYIEVVALAWASEGIDTVEKAEASAALYNSNYSAVSKAFGLNRLPGTAEQQFINKWINTFGFSIDIIVEACNRTILSTQKPDFKYADKILDNWNKNKVHHLSDIKKLDSIHYSTKQTTNTAKAAPKSTSPNKFNAFPQRSYSASDYTAMEQRLLNQSNQNN